MTPDEINIAIAESVGWSRAIIGTQSKSDPIPRGWRTPKGSERTKLPDYYHDLNAIHEVEAGLDDDAHAKYRAWLAAVVSLRTDTKMFLMSKNEYRLWFSATAPQRCEAYLRTIGKWKEADAQAGH